MEEQQRHRLEAQLGVNRVDQRGGNKQAEISQETKEETREEIRGEVPEEMEGEQLVGKTSSKTYNQACKNYFHL